jgi:membrane protein YfhO
MNDQNTSYTPSRPDLVALGLLCLWVIILSLPMWSGQYMAGPMSDQYSTGWAIRHWGAEQWRATGHLPLWDPERLSGVVVVAGFGDLFYPTAWLRLVLPTTLGIDLAFVVHYILAGFFLYLFLRMLRVSWLGSVVGGTAYQLSGVIVSYASPGHDGKLFVTALFPLMLIALILGIRRRRLEGHALLGVAVGLALLSPQYQTTQYALVGSGLFALYLAFGEPEGLTMPQRWSGIGLALAGVLVGFGLSLIQVLPFLHYIPYSPRAGIQGFEWSTSYATPWIHVPEFFVSGFTGYGGTYWGPNSLKLHSEYLGLPVIALAILGAGGPRRRLVQWMIGIGVLFVLIALGSGTPFYRVWWALVPYVNKTRAPGIAFYVVGFATAVLAALGVERLERKEGRTWALAGVIAGGLVALLALTGTFGAIATSYAQTHQEEVGRPLVRLAAAAQSGIQWGGVGSGLALVAVAALVFLHLRGKVTTSVFALGLVLLIGADLWRAGQGFWHWSRPNQEQLASDDVIRTVTKTPLPYRLYDPFDVYPRDALMAHDVPQVTGYHGNHLQTYLDLIGGESEQENLHRSLNLWRLLAVRYLVAPDTVKIPGFHRILGPTRTGLGQQVYLYEADTLPVYVRVVPAAVKALPEQIVPTLIDPRLDYNRLVLFDTSQRVNPLPITVTVDKLQPSASRAAVAAWSPGKMSITLDPAPAAPSYVVVAENWYKDWHAAVDGSPTELYRGDQSLITVPVPAGARRIELVFDAQDYRTGKRATQLSLLILVVGLVVPPVWRRRRRG